MEYYYNTNLFPSSVESYKEAKVAVFGVPLDSTVDYLPGTRFGPKIIREAANFIEPFDIESEKNLLEEVKILDVGDISPIRGNAQETLEKIEKKVKELIEIKKFPLMLGGEHLISLGAVRGLPKGSKIVCFDAHYDLKEVWEGSEYTHNTWLRKGIKIVGKNKVCLIGPRTGDEFEHEFSKDILVNPNFKNLEKFVKGRYVYLTVDMDVFDPSIAPGVGTPEPGGIGYQDFIEKLKMICNYSNLIGMDVVETRPLGENKITEILAAKIIFKVLNYEFIG
ncbi:MAG: agmatinase [Candidatus Aenigmarchaeota archaeon]|nr:agmatinase [Candidatus Aenigmarchaeota archaeon]